MKLGNVAKVQGGFAFKSSEFQAHGVPLIRIGNIDGEKVLLDNEVCYSETFWECHPEFRVTRGSILVAMSGATVGKVGRYEYDKKALLNQRVGNIVPDENRIIKDYLYYYCKSPLFQKSIAQNAFGCAQPNISAKQIEEFEIVIPSIQKQKINVEVLKKIDKIIIRKSEQLEYLDTLIKSRFVEMFGDPIDNPMGWEKRQLQKIVADDCTISYGIVQTGDEQEEGVPVLRPVDVVNKIPRLEELKKTTEEISNKYKKTILKGREMLITVRANIADTCIVGEEFRGCNVGRGIVPIRTKEDIMLLEFLKYQIDNKHFNDSIKSKAKGITLIQLNMEELRIVELVVPPIVQQIAFVNFVEQVDKLKVAVQKSLDETQLLMDSLMQQYFG